VIPVETWFPVVTLLAGTMIGEVLEALRDRRAMVREAIARAEARTESDRFRSIAFQRETLLAVQDHFTTFVRQIGEMHHHLLMAHYQSGKEGSWGSTRLPEALNDGIFGTAQQVGKLRVRIADEKLRGHLKKLNSIYSGVAIAKTEAESAGLMRELPDLVEALNERVGELLRQS
jgi:hypothetical protein